MPVSSILRQSDKLGILSSSLCLVHCLSLPLLISSQPLAYELFAHEYHTLEYLFLAFSFVAVYLSARNHHSLRIKLSFYGVLSLFVLGFLLEESLPWFKYLGYAASLGLISLHLWNWKQGFEVKTKNKSQVLV